MSHALCQFWNDKSIPLQILYSFSVSWKITPLYFFSSKIYTLLKRNTLKWKIWVFQVLGSKFVNFLMSILKRQVNSSSNFASFFIVMTQNSSVNFKLMLFLLWINESHQSLKTFKCSSGNLPYSSCYFPNHKSVFLQILHHPSVSWKITPLFFFRSNIKYFA